MPRQKQPLREKLPIMQQKPLLKQLKKSSMITIVTTTMERRKNKRYRSVQPPLRCLLLISKTLPMKRTLERWFHI